MSARDEVELPDILINRLAITLALTVSTMATLLWLAMPAAGSLVEQVRAVERAPGLYPVAFASVAAADLLTIALLVVLVRRVAAPESIAPRNVSLTPYRRRSRLEVGLALASLPFLLGASISQILLATVFERPQADVEWYVFAEDSWAVLVDFVGYGLFGFAASLAGWRMRRRPGWGPVGWTLLVAGLAYVLGLVGHVADFVYLERGTLLGRVLVLPFALAVRRAIFEARARARRFGRPHLASMRGRGVSARPPRPG
ncbi:MAG TPA: hypothetical protein RMH85_03025 [Polyangiaceae bacterium LLY-WYZ-15_(1-7)]|nr:hypothetical protein [Myxococcales bacterium]MAT23388.1 hypothetical protein [Sandaracinus sp.]HJK91071.1 hypothetical protein [Polyangiaceae bacterium LLY-WYZ-15_(1-7)]MBJ75160.1 hypothetical protein [Sandaracinus sp.]HJL04654.1 hypothetical protein [Polyangiaceae bacterium LLY-WYZ-15_(1-7)]